MTETAPTPDPAVVVRRAQARLASVQSELLLQRAAIHDLEAEERTLRALLAATVSVSRPSHADFEARKAAVVKILRTAGHSVKVSTITAQIQAEAGCEGMTSRHVTDILRRFPELFRPNGRRGYWTLRSEPAHVEGGETGT